jgi:FkbM family methyltransferase
MLPPVNLVRTDKLDYLLFSTNDRISRAIAEHGVWEQWMISLSQAFCDGVDAPLVIDAGANLGGYLLPMARYLRRSGGQIWGFEAQRIVYYQLCGNVFLNRLDNAHVFHKAVGHKDAGVTMPTPDYAVSRNVGAASLLPWSARPSTSNAKPVRRPREPVEMVRLDSISLPKAPSLIKIDVEGFELKVVKGAAATIENAGFPPLLLEAWTHEQFKVQRQQLIKYLEKLGYSLIAISDELLAQHPGYPVQVDLRFEAGAVSFDRVR